MGVEVHRWKPKARTFMCVAAPGSNHSLATAPTGRTLASLCLLLGWFFQKPAGQIRCGERLLDRLTVWLSF